VVGGGGDDAVLGQVVLGLEVEDGLMSVWADATVDGEWCGGVVGVESFLCPAHEFGVSA